MPEYLIYYSFAGSGRVTIEADNEDEARDKFNDGDCWLAQAGKEDCDDYEAHDIKLLD